MPEPPLYRRLHVATIVMQILANSRVLVAMVFTFALSIFSTGPKSGRADMVTNSIGAGFAVLAILPAVFRYLTVKYAIVDGAFVLRSGLVFRQVRTIPLERIQNINLKRNVLQRLMKVATLQIETASGTGVEAELAVIGDVEAERLAEALQGVSASRTIEGRDRDLVYAATPGQLFVAGATQNRAGHIVLFFLGLLQYADDVARNVFDRLARFTGPVLNSKMDLTTIVMIGTVCLVLLIMAGWILSVVGSFVGDWGFTLRSEGGLLRLRHGMFTQLESAVPARRVQALRFDSPIIQRRLGYCQVYAESAGSYQDKSAGGSAKLCPLLERDSAETLGRLVFPALRLDDVPWRQVSPLTVRRGFIRTMLTWAFFIGAGAIGWNSWLWLALLPAALHASYLGRHRFRIMGYAIEDGFIYSRTGVWRRRIVAVPEDRIQAATVTQSPFQRRWNIADLNFVTAGATQHAKVEIIDLPTEEAYRLQDRMMNRSRVGPQGGL
ncbi:MAG: PH domain-containing protein [Fimbriimonas sp.]